MLTFHRLIAIAVMALAVHFFLWPDNVQSAKVNCRCGPKPWSSRDISNRKHSQVCCQYFVESGEGNFTASSSLCHIENEFIYKRFHSCCINRLKSAYCYQQQINEGADGNEKATSDRWSKYDKIFGSSPFGR